MAISEQKNQLISWIQALNNESAINQKMKLRNKMDDESDENEIWDTLSNEEKGLIERGLEDIESGRTHSNQSVRKLYERYL